MGAYALGYVDDLRDPLVMLDPDNPAHARNAFGTQSVEELQARARAES